MSDAQIQVSANTDKTPLARLNSELEMEAEVAKSLTSFARDRNLIRTIEGRDYLLNEAHQWLFRRSDQSPLILYVYVTDDGKGVQYKAYGVVMEPPRFDGEVSKINLSTPDGPMNYELPGHMRTAGWMTFNTQENVRGKGNRPSYADFSMVQTRCTGKLGRLVNGYIVQMAGFEPTPYEEMQPLGKPASSKTAQSKPVSLEDRIVAACKSKDVPFETVQEFINNRFGATEFASLDMDNLKEVRKFIDDYRTPMDIDETVEALQDIGGAVVEEGVAEADPVLVEQPS